MKEFANFEDIKLVDSIYYYNRVDYVIGKNCINLDKLERSYFVKLVSFDDINYNVRYIIASSKVTKEGVKPYFLNQK